MNISASQQISIAIRGLLCEWLIGLWINKCFALFSGATLESVRGTSAVEAKQPGTHVEFAVSDDIIQTSWAYAESSLEPGLAISTEASSDANHTQTDEDLIQYWSLLN